jgi:hypothetical protein
MNDFELRWYNGILQYRTKIYYTAHYPNHGPQTESKWGEWIAVPKVEENNQYSDIISDGGMDPR